jgi:FemAB-related protein (PEP-CTERM system-associated)
MTMLAPPPMLAVREATLSDSALAQRIDAFVRAQEGATPFHLTGWSRAVASGCGQKARYLVAEDGEGTVAGVLPLTAIRSPLFGSALVSAGFGVGGGVLAALPQAATQLIDAATALATENGCTTIELRGGHIPPDWQVDDTTYLGFGRALADSDEAELLAIPRKQRAEVRKALENRLHIETGTAPRDRDAHFGVYAESVRNLGTPVFPPALFAAVLDEFGEDADILTVRHGRTPVASVLSLYFKGTVMPYWGGGTAAARSLRANDLMYYALMRHARNDKGCSRFDFGRSKAGTGPAAFKKNCGFSGVPLSYGMLALNGAAPRQINPLDPKYRMQIALWKRLPLPVANRIGPLIARGLG